MPDLSDKLKALGVRLGVRHLTPPPPRLDYPIENVIPGRLVDTPAGQAYRVEQFYPPDYRHGRAGLNLYAPLQVMARWVNEPLVNGAEIKGFAFLDTETSGLAGGTGTYAFLVGAGRYEGDQFHLAQFFMRDPTEEPAMLLALEAFLVRSTVLVTFNGKAFDIPLLNTRFAMQGWASPLADLAHVDLLHLARRLWRERLPSRTLGNLEVQILDAHRTVDEVPGWMIPHIYFDYLRSGDARPMKNVFYHNAMDVLSMAALLDHTAELLANPMQIPPGNETDQAAIARIYEDLGELDLAAQLYRQSLENGLPDRLMKDTLQRLSFLHKRRGELTPAMELWTKAANLGHIYAYIELAKVYEHTQKDYSLALGYTEQALEIVRAPSCPPVERLTWMEELEYRLQRLQNKKRIIRNYRGGHLHGKSQ